MSSSVTQVAVSKSKSLDLTGQIAIIVAASLFVAVCARFSLPIPGTPVPLSLQNFAVLLVGLSLGSRRGFIALGLYLAEGAAGLPVFSPVGAPGILRFAGPTAGYLIAYPLVAALAGYIFERGKQTFARAISAALLGELLLFACGVSWLYVLTHSLARAIALGLYWFIFAEVMKVMFAAGIASTWRRFVPNN
ncbi:MAG: biotin transporter BioY [Acidobacteria bacterium]|nr:MAG: biotin transporter BioY [Acidobacteriota bacterium]